MGGLSIWHWLIILLFIVVVVGVMMVAGRLRRRQGRDKADPNPLSGVRGWLALLVAGLLMIGPLMLLGQTANSISEAQSTYPKLLHLPQWSDYKSSMWGIVLLCVALSVWAGWGLMRGNSLGHVRRAQVVLWIIGPAKNFALGLILPVVIFGHSSFDGQALASLIEAALVATIWTIYLQSSKRVKATYPLGR